jgi:hypothetical protein
MKGKSQIKIAITGIALIFLCVIMYLFLWGKLFPFSPVIIGFSKHELSNTVIYVQKGAEYSDFERINKLTPDVENFHEFKFIKKPRIFIFRDKESYLHRSISKARFCAFPGGSLVISPWAIQEDREGKISLEIYIKHELSHVLLYQHKGILTSLMYPNWLLEGIAVYSTNQMGTSFYPGKEETYRLINQGNFVPPEFFKTKKEDKIPLNVTYRVTFMYSEFACIVDYLVNNYGKEKFLVYMKSLLKNNNHDKVFKDVYGIDFKDFLLYFKKFVSENDKPV